MADLEVTSMTDEEFANHWRARSDVVGEMLSQDAKLKLLSLQIDWFEGVGDNRTTYRIKDGYRDASRVEMLRKFTIRIDKALFGPSVA